MTTPRPPRLLSGPARTGQNTDWIKSELFSMTAPYEHLLEARREFWVEQRAANLVLCKCQKCERDEPIHERSNFISRSTAAKHRRAKRRRTGQQAESAEDCSFWQTSELVRSYATALGLTMATDLMQEAAPGGQQGAGGLDQPQQPPDADNFAQSLEGATSVVR